MLRRLGLIVVMFYSSAALADPVDDIINAEMQRQHIPGLSLAVVLEGKVIKEAGYGLANVEHSVRVTPDTVFQSGSIGKQFTAALVMLMVEDGKLKLDDPVSAYLPGTPQSWKMITLRRLLSHTAGMADSDPAVDLRKDYSEDELLQSAFKVPPIAAPGEKWGYSNLGYQVLGILCSRAGGKFYGEQLRERIFEPLGMQTRIISERNIVPNRAAGYDRIDGELFNQEWVAPTINTTADGSLYLTVRDLARWSVALEGNAPLNEAIRTASWTPAKLNNGELTDYGFGWQVDAVKGHRLVQHSGSWQGFNSFIVRYLDDRLAVIVLANRSHSRLQLITERIAWHYLPALEPAPTPPLTTRRLESTPFFLRGSMNEWGVRDRMRRVRPGIFEATIALEAGDHWFKIAAEDWSKLGLGSRFDENRILLSEPHALEEWGEDLAISVKTAAAYVFRLDARNPLKPTLSVREAPAR